MDIKWVKLGEVFEIQRGKRITKEWIKFHPGKYPVYSAKITGDLVMGYIDQYLFDGEYLLISSYGEAGNVSYVKNKFWAIDSATLLKNKNSNRFNIKFYMHYLNLVAKNYVNTAATPPSLTPNVIANILVPLIPIDQQNRIASVLDTIAELKAELRARDKQNKYYQEHLLSEESLSGKLWGFKEEIIKYVKLSEVFEIQRGKRITKEWMKFHPGKYPVYSAKITGDLVMGYIDQYLFDGEYLLISSYGEAGNVSYVKNKFWAIDSATLLKNKNSNRFNIKFYMHYLNLVAKNYVNTAATPPSLTPNVIANILVPLPSLKIQNKIVAVMDKLESLINSVNGDIPVEISTREDQYKYYSELLLSY
ncbi:MAG: type I restriction-modification system, DNA specificity (S) subunit [Candidatus Malacoplasma girerdii]|nr:MAG: type I restriction-modification system, DNA specificity (S) subunit [Candidatus Malacoplasma girerdii]